MTTRKKELAKRILEVHLGSDSLFLLLVLGLRVISPPGVEGLLLASC